MPSGRNIEELFQGRLARADGKRAEAESAAAAAAKEARRRREAAEQARRDALAWYEAERARIDKELQGRLKRAQQEQEGAEKSLEEAGARLAEAQRAFREACRRVVLDALQDGCEACSGTGPPPAGSGMPVLFLDAVPGRDGCELLVLAPASPAVRNAGTAPDRLAVLAALVVLAAARLQREYPGEEQPMEFFSRDGWWGLRLPVTDACEDLRDLFSIALGDVLQEAGWPAAPILPFPAGTHEFFFTVEHRMEHAES